MPVSGGAVDAANHSVPRLRSEHRRRSRQRSPQRTAVPQNHGWREVTGLIIFLLTDSNSSQRGARINFHSRRHLSRQRNGCSACDEFTYLNYLIFGNEDFFSVPKLTHGAHFRHIDI